MVSRQEIIPNKQHKFLFIKPYTEIQWHFSRIISTLTHKVTNR